MSEENPSVPSAPVTEAQSVPSPETAPAVEAVPAKTTLASPQFAALAKKEKAILARDQQIKAREQALAAREEEINRYASLKDKAKANPLDALKEIGLDYNTIVDYMLNNGAPSPELQVKKVQERLDNMEKERISATEKAAKDAADQALKEKAEAESEFRDEIKQYITANAGTYEYVNIVDGSDIIVFNTIDDYYTEHQKVLSVEEATKMVDEYLYETYYAPALKTKKISALLAPPKASDSKPTTPSRTLSNVTSSVPSSLPAKTEQDRLQRALAALNRG